MDDSPVNACPACGKTLRPWFVKQGHEILSCRECGVIAAGGVGSAGRDGRTVYEGTDNIFLKDNNELYYLDETNLWSFREKLVWVQRHVARGGRLLDAGSNFGHFLKTAEGSYDAMGFDISDVAVEWSRKNFGVKAIVASVYDIRGKETGHFDAITCWDFIEHLPDPAAAIRILESLLAPGGKLFFSTPDAGSTLARIEGRFWHFIDPVQHRFLFPHGSLGQLLEQEGLMVVDRCSFGHYYRLRYVFNRLLQLHERGLLRVVTIITRKALFFMLDRPVYVKMGDVMGLAATVRGSAM